MARSRLRRVLRNIVSARTGIVPPATARRIPVPAAADLTLAPAPAISATSAPSPAASDPTISPVRIAPLAKKIVLTPDQRAVLTGIFEFTAAPGAPLACTAVNLMTQPRFTEQARKSGPATRALIDMAAVKLAKLGLIARILPQTAQGVPAYGIPTQAVELAGEHAKQHQEAEATILNRAVMPTQRQLPVR